MAGVTYHAFSYVVGRAGLALATQAVRWMVDLLFRRVLEEVVWAGAKWCAMKLVKGVAGFLGGVLLLLIRDPLERWVRGLKIAALVGGIVFGVWLACRYKLLGSLCGTSA